VSLLAKLVDLIPEPADALKYFGKNEPGLLASGLAHGLVLLLILFWFKSAPHPSPEKLRTVLVDIVLLGGETRSPPSPQKSAMPQQQAFARRTATAHSPPVGVEPNRTKPPDDFQNRLNALSKLRAPETDTQALRGAGESHAESTSNDAAPGSEATYTLRDFIRAQVMRRWNLDLSTPGGRATIVALRIVMKNNGTISTAEFVDKRRYATDAAYRQIAMSARNAVLLSSPIALPAGNYPAEIEMTLHLDPRDALR
jgi:hypothetical protein